MKDFFVHQNGLCETQAIGKGTKIWAFAHVMNGAEVGANCNICDHAYIEGGVQVGNDVTVKNQVMIFKGASIGDGVFIGPGASFTNDLYPRSPRLKGVPALKNRYNDQDTYLQRTWVETGASIGARAVILPGVTVGAFAMVGSQALVTQSVPPHALVVGVPARQKGWVCFCGLRLASRGPTEWTCDCGEKFTLKEPGNLQAQRQPTR